MKKIKTLLLISMILVAAIFTGCAAKVTTVAITQIVDHPSLNDCREGSVDMLAELGYVEGDDFVIDYESAQGDPAIASTIAQQFVAKKVDCIIAISTPSAQAAYGSAMTEGIPVVFSAVTSPTAAELANPDGTPLENITGCSDEMPMQGSFDLIKAILPDATKVGILHNTSEVNSDVQLVSAVETAEAMGMEVIDIGITSTNDIASALDVLLPQVDVVLNLTDNMVVSSLPLILEKTNEAMIPLIGSEDAQVTNGALASAGIDYYNLGQQVGAMVAKILEGTPAQDIPIETLKEIKLTINTDAAKLLGITLPADLVSKATDVAGE